MRGMCALRVLKDDGKEGKVLDARGKRGRNAKEGRKESI